MLYQVISGFRRGHVPPVRYIKTQVITRHRRQLFPGEELAERRRCLPEERGNRRHHNSIADAAPTSLHLAFAGSPWDLCCAVGGHRVVDSTVEQCCTRQSDLGRSSRFAAARACRYVVTAIPSSGLDEGCCRRSHFGVGRSL